MSYFSYFSSCFLLLLLLLLLLLPAIPSVQKDIFKRQSPKTEPLPAQKLPTVTSETYRKQAILATFSSYFLLFPPAAAPAPASLFQKGIFKRQSPKIEPLPAANPTCYFFCSKRYLQKGVA